MNARYLALTTNRAMILEHPVLTHYNPVRSDIQKLRGVGVSNMDNSVQ